MPAGRPTKRTPAMTEKICTWLASGKSLRSFCRDNEDAPELSNICKWIVVDDEFRQHYARAREAAGFSHADNMISIIEQLMTGDQIDPQRARVAMDGLKWAAERMAPKSHAVRQEIDHLSSDGSMKPVTEITLRGVKATEPDGN